MRHSAGKLIRIRNIGSRSVSGALITRPCMQDLKLRVRNSCVAQLYAYFAAVDSDELIFGSNGNGRVPNESVFGCVARRSSRKTKIATQSGCRVFFLCRDKIRRTVRIAADKPGTGLGKYGYLYTALIKLAAKGGTMECSKEGRRTVSDFSSLGLTTLISPQVSRNRGQRRLICKTI